MKYDLIQVLRDSNIDLSTTQESILRIIQDQHFPELDGLKVSRTDGIKAWGIPGEGSIISQGFVVLKNSQDLDARLNKEKPNELSIFVKDNSTCHFNIKYGISQNNNNMHYFECMYIYGNDVIHFKKDKDSGNVTISLFANVVGKTNVAVNLFGIFEANHILPDITITCSTQDDRYYIVDGVKTNIKIDDTDEILYKWRMICNKIADQYHQKYEEELQPPKSK